MHRKQLKQKDKIFKTKLKGAILEARRQIKENMKKSKEESKAHKKYLLEQGHKDLISRGILKEQNPHDDWPDPNDPDPGEAALKDPDKAFPGMIDSSIVSLQRVVVPAKWQVDYIDSSNPDLFWQDYNRTEAAGCPRSRKEQYKSIRPNKRKKLKPKF